jgi:hypothetical protein
MILIGCAGYMNSFYCMGFAWNVPQVREGLKFKVIAKVGG